MFPIYLRKNRFTFYLLLTLVAGSILGIFQPTWARAIEPIGKLFLNLIYCLIVPLIFFGVLNAIMQVKINHAHKNIFRVSLLVFLTSSLILGIFTYLMILIFNPFSLLDTQLFEKPHNVINAVNHLTTAPERNFLRLFTDAVSQKNILDLFQQQHILALITFATLLGYSFQKARLSDATNQQFINFVGGMNQWFMAAIELLMKASPLGLGCYFAAMVADIGVHLVSQYIYIFIFYLSIAFITYIIIFPIYVYIASGKIGVKNWWRSILTPTMTAMGTCSSIACIPINIQTAQKMHVPSYLAQTILPLGANIHKDGSVIGGILKVGFVLTMTGVALNTWSSFGLMMSLGLIVGIVMGGVPSGGFVAEVLVCHLMGVSSEYVAVLIIINTITDIPSTTINSISNLACLKVINRWIK